MKSSSNYWYTPARDGSSCRHVYTVQVDRVWELDGVIQCVGRSRDKLACPRVQVVNSVRTRSNRGALEAAESEQSTLRSHNGTAQRAHHLSAG